MLACVASLIAAAPPASAQGDPKLVETCQGDGEQTLATRLTACDRLANDSELSSDRRAWAAARRGLNEAIRIAPSEPLGYLLRGATADVDGRTAS